MPLSEETYMRRSGACLDQVGKPTIGARKRRCQTGVESVIGAGYGRRRDRSAKARFVVLADGLRISSGRPVTAVESLRDAGSEIWLASVTDTP